MAITLRYKVVSCRLNIFFSSLYVMIFENLLFATISMSQVRVLATYMHLNTNIKLVQVLKDMILEILVIDITCYIGLNKICNT